MPKDTANVKRSHLSEHVEQTILIRWCRSEHAPREAKHIFSIPNGGVRNKITAARLKEEGATAGIPDLFLPVARHDYHGLFIEMKVGYNKPTAHQKEAMSTLTQQGFKCVVCYGHEDAIEQIQWYLG